MVGLVVGSAVTAVLTLYSSREKARSSSVFSSSSCCSPSGSTTNSLNVSHARQGHDLVTRMLNLFESTWGNASLSNARLGSRADGSTSVKALSGRCLDFATPQEIKAALDEAGGLEIQDQGLDGQGGKGDDALWRMLSKVRGGEGRLL